MKYVYSSFTYPSSDGKNTVTAHVYAPQNGNIKGVIQICHGMVDHVLRYENLAVYLTERGYVLAGNDHLGHGATAASEEDFGFFADSDSITYILKDLHAMNRKLREMYPGSKPVMMGHSMGSFLSRLYAIRYPNSISGHIIHGTGGPMGAILPLGKALVNTIIFFRGKHYRSKLVKKISFMGYNSKFPKEDGEDAWLTRDTETVKDRGTDKRTDFIFTLAAYRDLFSMVGQCNSKKWFREYPSSLKTLIISGDMDPVGNYGEGPKYVYKHLLIHGTEDLTLKLYEGARHELFNETTREEIFSDMESWLEGALK